MHVEIKKKADIEKAVGPTLARAILNLREARDNLQVKPRRLSFYTEKPKFYLDDGSTLKAYAVHLETGKVIGARYAGSGESAINHPEQHASFRAEEQIPPNHALMFVESYWNGTNHSWTVHIVARPENLQRFLEASSHPEST